MTNSPYLSVVATARNDNHGGDLLHRMQTFVNALAAQCERHRLDVELVLVEWNPPQDRPSLVDALEWPVPSPWFAARVVEVPAEQHLRLSYADRLPLFQMIAKNVGIRRARGQYVLATNVDLVFSDELMSFLARRRLDSTALYRVDRYDTEPRTLDPTGSIDEQLRACEASLIRICRRDGTKDLRTGEFFRIYEEQGFVARLLAERVSRLASEPRTPLRAVALAAGRRAVFVERLAQVAALAFVARCELATIRVLRAGVNATHAVISAARKLVRALPRARHPHRAPHVYRRVSARWRARLLARRRRVPVDGDVGALHAIAALFVALQALSGKASGRLTGARRAVLVRLLAVRQAWEWETARVRLHTNACGDFTLLSRAAWDRTRAYPELELFSMHLDSLFLYQAHWSGIEERYLPYRLYHLEHGAGFKPDEPGLKALNERLERDAIPQVSNDQFLEWALEMFRTRRPLPFNDDAWGMRDVPLREHDAVRASVPERMGVA